MVVHGLCGRVADSAGNACSLNCCCSDIANLSAHLHRLPTPPPYLRRMRLLPSLGAVPANHLPRWVPPHALLARGSVDGATNLSSSSTVIKVNCLSIRYLHFESVRGDLQEGNGSASRCQFLLFLCRSPFFPSTKSPFLCAFGVWNPHFRAFRAQNRGFCALLPASFFPMAPRPASDLIWRGKVLRFG